MTIMRNAFSETPLPFADDQKEISLEAETLEQILSNLPQEYSDLPTSLYDSMEDLQPANISDLLAETIMSEINIELYSSDAQLVNRVRSIDNLKLQSTTLSNFSNSSNDNFLIANSNDLNLSSVLPLSTTNASLTQNTPLPTNNVGFTGNIYADGILWGGNRWDTGPSKQIDYSFWNSGTESFDDSTTNKVNTVYDWNIAEKTAMVNALNTWAAVADITFVDVGDNNANATFGFYLVDDTAFSLPNINGGFGPPATLGAGIGYFNLQGLGWDSQNGNQQGDFGFVTMVHEFGHGLGLAHPHDNSAGSSIYPGVTFNNALGEYTIGDYGLNQGLYTTMSYNESLIAQTGQYQNSLDYGYQGTPMAFDIATIQYLYGANLNYNTGNNTYFLPTVNASGTSYSSIWDAGGIDTISGFGAYAGVAINLYDATLNIVDGAGAGGYLSSVTGVFGGFTIANSVIIENADGSVFDDTINGNEFNNALFGDAGNDALFGESSNDTLTGGAGNDTLVGYSNGEEWDVLAGGAGNDVFVLGYDTGAFYQGNGYALITDFNRIEDYIQVKGTANQYSLQFDNWIGGSALDTTIFYGTDAIGVILDNTNVSLQSDFIFV